MDYRIAQTQHQKFLAIVKRFSNEIINDPNNHEVSDFWNECLEKNLINPMLDLRPSGKRDLYGLCTPAKEGEDSFEYGIGVLMDEETHSFDFADAEQERYRIWDVMPGTYAVFDCIGEDGDCITDTWARFYREFLPQMGYEAESETDYELYPENGQNGLFCELWIPVKKK